MVINGEYPEMFQCINCKSSKTDYFSVVRGGMLCNNCVGRVNDGVHIDTSTVYTMQFIITSKTEKLFTFVVSEKVLSELGFIMKRYMSRYVDKAFNSLEILNTILK